THVVAGVVVLLAAALSWLVSALAVTESTHAPAAVVVPLTLVFGLLVGAVSRAIAGGPTRDRAALAGRAALAIPVGGAGGELAAVVVFSGSIDRLHNEAAARGAASTPAVAQAAAELDGVRHARAALDTAVDDASRQRDDALVVARCEYHPSPACPQ